MPAFYLDIDSPTLAQGSVYMYDGYSSGINSATKSAFSDSSPQRWPSEFSPASYNFDFDPDDEGGNPFVYDVEASGKGMALPPPPPLLPEHTRSGMPTTSPLISPGFRRGPLSYYGSIFGHGHTATDLSNSTTITCTDSGHTNHTSEFKAKTPQQEQVSPLTPSIETFELLATCCRPVSELPPDHPPTPAMQRFRIVAVGSIDQPYESNPNVSPIPSLESDLESDSELSSPQLSGGLSSNPKSSTQTPQLIAESPVKEEDKIDQSEAAVNGQSAIAGLVHSLLWPGRPTLLSLKEDCHSDLDKQSWSDKAEKYLPDFTKGYDSGDEDERSYYGSDYVSHDDLDCEGGLDSPHVGRLTDYNDNHTPDWDLEQVGIEANASEVPDFTSDSDALATLIEPQRSINQGSQASSPDLDHEMFEQLGITLPLPPASVQAPAWAGPQRDLKALIREHLEATGQLKAEKKRLPPQPVITNQIHFMPLAGPQTSISDPGAKSSIDIPQWIPSPETPTFGTKIQNKVRAILKPEKKQKPTAENRNSIRTEKLLEEGFKSASLYTKRKRVNVDKAKIGAPVGPAIITHDSRTQELVALAEEWKKHETQGGANSTNGGGLASCSTVSLPSTRPVETFETDDDVSSVDNGFVVHTPLRPRSVLPERDRRRRSRSLPGSFTFTIAGISTDTPFDIIKTSTVEEVRAKQEGNGVIEEEMVPEKERELKDLKGGSKKSAKEEEQEEKRADDDQGESGTREYQEIVEEEKHHTKMGQQSMEDLQEGGQNEVHSFNHIQFSGSISEESHQQSAASINNCGSIDSQTHHTVFYEDVMFELIPQRTVSGTSIWLGSDTPSPAGSLRKNSLPSEEDSLEGSLTSPTTSPIISISSPQSSSTVETPISPIVSYPVSEIEEVPETEELATKAEYNSPVQARLIIPPATEIYIPFLLENSYCLDSPAPRVIFEDKPNSILKTSPTSASPLPALMPLHLPNLPLRRRSTTLCSPGAGKANGVQIPLRQKSISKPLTVKGSTDSVASGCDTMGPAYMVPTRHPPLPLRRSQSQKSVRPPLSPQTGTRRPSDGNIAQKSLPHNNPLSKALPPPSNNFPRNRSFTSTLKDQAVSRTPSNSKVTKLPRATCEKPQEQHRHLQRFTESDCSGHQLTPLVARKTLPASPRPVRAKQPHPGSISIPQRRHTHEQAEIGVSHILTPLTPATGKLIYSASDVPPCSPTRPYHASSLPLFDRSSKNPRAPTYIYIPYTIPKIGGGVIEREHRLKLAVGRAGKRVRTCKECGQTGNIDEKNNMWFCLEGGCSWEMCGECVKREGFQ